MRSSEYQICIRGPTIKNDLQIYFWKLKLFWNLGHVGFQNCLDFSGEGPNSIYLAEPHGNTMWGMVAAAWIPISYQRVDGSQLHSEEPPTLIEF